MEWTLKQQRYSGKRINATTRANDPNTQIHRDLDSMRQKINKDIKHLNSDPEQVNLINIYRALHFKYTKYILVNTTSHLLRGLNEIFIGHY